MPVGWSPPKAATSSASSKCWTDDAVVMPPACRRRQPAACAMRGGQPQDPGLQDGWRSTDVKFSPDGNLAIILQEYGHMDGADGAPDDRRPRGLIWRRDPDGEWRCALDIWNAEPTT